MTRIGAFADLHANLPALDALLAEFDRQGCDQVISVGNAVGDSPASGPVFDRMVDAGVTMLLGDSEVSILVGAAAPEYLSKAQTNTVRRLCFMQSVFSGDQRVSFQYFGLRGGRSEFLSPSSEIPVGEHLDAMFYRLPGTVVVHGSAPAPSDVLTSSRRYINPGAAGCSPEARYAVVDILTDRVEATVGSASYETTGLRTPVLLTRPARIPRRQPAVPAFRPVVETRDLSLVE